VDAAVRVTSRVARERFGGDVAVRGAAIISRRARSQVVRCSLTPWPGAPGSLIAKQHTADDARGFSDWASLAFLSSLESAEGVAPRFYGGDADERVCVMEDLGEPRTMDTVFATGDDPASRGALRQLGATMARLVAATSGPSLEARYEALRGRLPGDEGLGRRHESERWRAGWPRLTGWLGALGCPVDGRVEAELAYVATVFAEPGRFLAFSHGDPAPSNNQVGKDEVRLLDFEYGAYRHALYDVTGWYVLCPLPETWVEEIHGTFRRHLARTWAPAADEAGYREGWAVMCAYRAVAMLSWLAPDIMYADRPWVEDWTMRGALLAASTRLGRAAAGVASLSALGDAGDRLAQAARGRWPELGDGLPHWPDGTSVSR
jgi:hypothetical protein